MKAFSFNSSLFFCGGWKIVTMRDSESWTRWQALQDKWGTWVGSLWLGPVSVVLMNLVGQHL
jgi:hypothetical protein